MNDCEIERRVTIKAHSWTIYQQNFLVWHKTASARWSGWDPGHREESENTACGRSGCKTKHYWGLGVAIKKWSRTPSVSKLTHMVISCRDLVGSHRKVSNSRGMGPAARWGGVPKVAPEPSPYMVLSAVWLVALVFQKVAPEPPPWPVGVLVVAPMGWCWGGVPKSCPRIPTARWDGVPKVGVVLQKVVPESPLCILILAKVCAHGTD